MNYPTFLKKVDALTSRCDADSLRLFVHEIARTIQEDNRERFLLTLEGFSDAVESNSTRISEDDNMERRVDDILRALSGIQNGDRELEAEYNEMWDDWSDEEEEEYEFSDPDSLLDDIENAFAAMHECLDKEEYGKGLELARALSCLEVKLSEECLDYDDTFDIADLIDNNLLPINLEQRVSEAVCLAYMAGEKRAEDILAILKGFDCYSVSLEDILRIAPKEMELEKLLPEWIEALAKCPAKDTDKLLVDCFERWKENVTVDELECDTWIKRLERWIASRVSAIMAANRRNYYWECAAYIAAFGEMLQSRGAADAKETVMQRYRKEYSRRRAFQEELRRYGMKS